MLLILMMKTLYANAEDAVDADADIDADIVNPCSSTKRIHTSAHTPLVPWTLIFCIFTPPALGLSLMQPMVVKDKEGICIQMTFLSP